jgi:acetate kinase
MKILVINTGSSSVKFTLYHSREMRPLASGLVERIGLVGTTVHYSNAAGEGIKRSVAVNAVREAVDLIAELLTDPEKGVIPSVKAVSAIGHRVVHGGEQIKGSVIIDEGVKAVIRSCIELAPLHNPPNLNGIDACSERFPGLPQVAVFDTAFHSSLPEHAYLYALPYALYETEKIRRYGFHGTSHGYVSRRAAEAIGHPLDGLKMVTCHLGNGCSITAVDGGHSVDTSMGFTPLEGLPMGTRSGDIDPAILLYLMRRRSLSADQLDTLLNRESGILGLGQMGSSDMRDLEAANADGDPRAERVIGVFAYRIKKYIGSYAFAMGGLDAVVFTGGIGENSPLLRKRVCAGLEEFGVRIDAQRNRSQTGQHRIGKIHAPDSRVRILVVPTDEEREIARQTLKLVSDRAA